MEDQIFNAKYISLTDGFYCESKPLYHYWQREDSMVHNFSLKMVPDNIKANYSIGKIIVKSMIKEHKAKKEENTSQKLLQASEGSNNERKG